MQVLMSKIVPSSVNLSFSPPTNYIWIRKAALSNLMVYLSLVDQKKKGISFILFNSIKSCLTSLIYSVEFVDSYFAEFNRYKSNRIHYL